MKNSTLATVAILSLFTLTGCSDKIITLSEDNLEVVNRDILSISDHSLQLNNKVGDGLAIIEDVNFSKGVIELEIKGENNPGKSFVGFAFNIQNDSTYEAVYFRPFNFQSPEQIRREHSMQYISHPKNTWRYLRTNFEGQYEAVFPRKPDPNDWFEVSIEVSEKEVVVFDKNTDTELLRVERIETQKSDSVGFWTGFDSKGEFRNLRINK